MPDTLQAIDGKIAALRAEINQSNQVTGFFVDVNLSYQGPGLDKTIIGKQATIDFWALMTAQQKTNMQNMVDAILTKITEKYLA